jgi:MFS family permease
METSASGASGEWRANWKVVFASACGMSLVTMPTYTVGVFMAPLEGEFGWSRAQISSVLLAIAAFSVFIGPVVGMAIDRFGPRRISLAGVFMVCGSVALLSLTNGSFALWWALWCLVAFSGLFTKAAVWFSGVSSLFSAGRGIAFGVTLCGSSIGSALVPVLGNYLIENHGWRVAYLGISAAFLLIAAPPVLLFFTSAQDRSRVRRDTGATVPGEVLPGPAAREAILSLRFVKMALAGFGMTLCASSLTINLVPILVANGHARASAASMAGVLGLAAITGRLCTGVLLDRFNANLIAASFILATVLFSLLMLAFPGVLWIALLAIIVLGVSVGAELDAIAYLVTRHFGLRSFGVVFASIGGIMAIANGAGPVGISFAYDLSDSYRLALLASIPISIMTALLVLSLGRYPDFGATRFEAASGPASSLARDARLDDCDGIAAAQR